jgi:CDP-diacylglycerol--glycerol-3-phosphate 3-phosphatidyltransferase
MTTATSQPNVAKFFNVPNVITSVRLVLALLIFVLIPLQQYLAALAVFILAASTDWVDGYWARRFNQITQLGRIFDPFVDKIIICGTFILLGAETGSGVYAWMAVIVVGREMLVTAIRSFIEQKGGDFSASWSGKLKMGFQCAAVIASLLGLIYGTSLPAWLPPVRTGLVWLAVLSTLQSGVGYIVAAASFFRE